MHRILITGASGLLGSNLATEWAAREAVIGVSHRTAVQNGRFATVCADLTSAQETAMLLKDFRPSHVVHAAALTDVDLCEAQPDLAKLHNFLMTRNVAQAAHSIGAKLIYISTDAVFDGKRSNHTEYEPLSPVNMYACTKLMGEAAAFSEAPDVLVIRTNFYGWNLRPKKSLAEWILARLEQGELVPGFDDVFFSPILINSLGDILLDLIKHKAAGVYNIGSRERLSKYAFAVQLAKVFGFPSECVQPVSIHSGELYAPRPCDTSLDCTKASLTLGREMPKIYEDLCRFMYLRDQGYVISLKSLLQT
jgi:dTDP-4-dehydrorhamnose reductase